MICPPPLAEGPRNYRREFDLATALAEGGVARCDFTPSELGRAHDGPCTLGSMSTDASIALGALVSQFGDLPVAVIGTRLAAVVAARTVPAGGTLVLWDPVVDGSAYAKEVMRARRLSELASGESKGKDVIDTANNGTVDVVGYPVETALLDEVTIAPTCRSRERGPAHPSRGDDPEGDAEAGGPRPRRTMAARRGGRAG